LPLSGRDPVSWTGLTTAEREELARLRKENRVLQEQRDTLNTAAAFFAKQSR
jgi:transposase